MINTIYYVMDVVPENPHRLILRENSKFRKNLKNCDLVKVSKRM